MNRKTVLKLTLIIWALLAIGFSIGHLEFMRAINRFLAPYEAALWLITGIGLMVATPFVKRVPLFGVGYSVFLVGIVAALVPYAPWQGLLLVFWIVYMIGWFLFEIGRWLDQPQPGEVSPNINQQTRNLIGRVFTLKIPIKNQRGKLDANGTSWIIEGPDTSVGTKVKIVGIDGTMLLVEPITDKV